jgi:prolyl 4-hydroxylase
MVKNQFDKQWRDWIHHNVARGCSKAELLDILVREGFGREAAYRELNPLQIPSLRRVDTERAELYTAETFLSEPECRHLVNLMQGHLRPSTITVEDEPDQLFRRSQTCELDLLRDLVAERIDLRICQAMQISPALAEPTQAQRYEVDDEFKAHTDYFEAYELERFSTPTLGQRSWTFMIYLNEPERGGETAFVNLGLAIRPKTGLAVIWNNVLPGGQPNPDTLHHGMPVKAGYKAIITKWFRHPRAVIPS